LDFLAGRGFDRVGRTRSEGGITVSFRLREEEQQRGENEQDRAKSGKKAGF
jgi:hypothetical protein